MVVFGVRFLLYVQGGPLHLACGALVCCWACRRCCTCTPQLCTGWLRMVYHHVLMDLALSCP